MSIQSFYQFLLAHPGLSALLLSRHALLDALSLWMSSHSVPEFIGRLLNVLHLFI